MAGHVTLLKGSIMFTRIKRPSAPMVISIAALVVALGGTSYAAAQINSKDIANNAVTSAKIKNGTIKNKDLAKNVQGLDGADGSDGLDGTDGNNGVNGTDGADGMDGAPGPAGPAGPAGSTGPAGPAGPAGAAGTGRWLLVDRTGTIVAQSGGFSIRTAYGLVNNQVQTGTPPTTPAIPGGALGNVYIDANEILNNNGITASIALQNQFNQDGNAGNAGRNPGADSNPEFSGEITTTICGVTGIVACAPNGANFRDHFVVSPRMSDGSLTYAAGDPTVEAGNPASAFDTHKRFYVIITGDSSDVEPQALIDFPAKALAAN